jgi:nucleoid-associated protein EbfC
MRDMMGMMKKAQELQDRMTEAQAEFERILVQGTSGGGMVTVKMTAKGEVKAVSIDPVMMNADEREILEDLIIAACGDARGKGEQIMQERITQITKGLPMPPGLKLF